MKKMILAICMAALSAITYAATPADYRQVVPLPQSVTTVKGAPFVLNAGTTISYTPAHADMARNAAFLAQYVDDMTHLRLAVAEGKGTKGDIRLVLNPKLKGTASERYQVTVGAKGIVVTGATPAGVFYGIQTLRKALPVLDAADEVTLPAAVITDAPRFGYRGMHLDCSRHFFPVAFVKQYIDMLALHNMNRFHWHISDDQGWRFVVEQCPRLIEVGAWRDGTVLGRNSEVQDDIRYGGYYTDDEIRDIIRYAADRYITIIPEVDMPGHMMAALAAYPELGCTGGPYETGRYWGVYPDILCAGNAKTYDFVQTVLDKVCQLFPSEYIHIGGDESPRVRWEHCPKCQAVIAREGLVAKGGESKEAMLQGYFTRRVQHYLESKGRKIIGWDELLGCDVDTTATIMSWRGEEPGAKGATLGHDVIMSPQSHLYFDHYQSKQVNTEPPGIGGFSDVEKVYSLEPVAHTLTPVAKAHIIGVQANLWTEYIGSTNHAEYMVLPRMGALAEVQWLQPEAKDFEAFKLRLDHLRRIYERYGWHYAHHLWPEEFRKVAKMY